MAEPTSTILGIKLVHLVSGGLGGAVRAFIVGGGWVSGFVSIFVGGVTASYLTTPIYDSPLNYWHLPEGSIGYLVGLTGMLISEGILRYVRAWSKSPILPPSKKP